MIRYLQRGSKPISGVVLLCRDIPSTELSLEGEIPSSEYQRNPTEENYWGFTPIGSDEESL